jgi:nucleotide-binding universal stress UspA family protein
VFGSIVVGTDGSDSAREAVRQAVELAARLGARLDVVSAYEPMPGARLRDGEARPSANDPEWQLNLRDEVDATLRAAAEAAQAAGVGAHVHAREGDPADAILDVAEEQGSELIVIGNRGRTGARRFLLGSVPNRVSHFAPCSVLIIRTT